MGMVINTNMSSINAQGQLNKTSSQLSKTMERISSGNKVNSARDGGAKYASANALKNTAAIAKSSLDSLSGGKALVDNTLAAVSEVLGVLNKMQETVSVDSTQASNKDKIDNDLAELTKIIVNTIKNASYAGANLMTNSTEDSSGVNLSAEFKFLQGTDNKQGATNIVTIEALGLGDGSGVVTLDTLFGSESGLFAAEEFTAGSGDFVVDSQNIKADITGAINNLSAHAATLGAVAVGIETQLAVTNAFMESNQQALSDIMDADMGQESSAMKSLETKKQLGVTALSVANKESEAILKLVQ